MAYDWVDMGDREIDTGAPPAQKEPAPEQVGFLKGLLSFLFSEDDPAKVKRRLLKEIGKRLKKINQKYYSPRQEQALPGLAGLVYEYYKILGQIGRASL